MLKNLQIFNATVFAKLCLNTPVLQHIVSKDKERRRRVPPLYLPDCHHVFSTLTFFLISYSELYHSLLTSCLIWEQLPAEGCWSQRCPSFHLCLISLSYLQPCSRQCRGRNTDFQCVRMCVWVCVRDAFGDKDPCCRESCGKDVRPEDVSAPASDNVSLKDTACHFTQPHIKKDSGWRVWWGWGGWTDRGGDSMSFVCFDTRSH